MDPATRARYNAWKRRKLLKLAAISIGILIVLGSVVAFGLRLGDDDNGNGVIVNGTVTNEPTLNQDPDINTDPSNEEEGTRPSDELESTTTIRLQFAGDIFLHQGPMAAARISERTYDFRPFFTHIKPFIDADLAIANMEVPVDAFGDNLHLASFPLFNSPFEILDGLQYAGFNHLISANNHSFDKGFEGLLNTINSFERAGIAHTGMNANWDDFHTPTIIDVNGINVGILSYTDSVNGQEWSVPEASRAYAVRRFRSHTTEDVAQITQDMNELRTAGAELVIVALHWGAEYGDAPSDMQRMIASELVDAGADIIMGKHSHTVHPVRWHYRSDGSRGFIMYSLGNFLADQTRLTSPSVHAQITEAWTHHQFIGRTQFGMLVSIEATRQADGQIELETAHILPTLCMRDFTGNTLGSADDVTILPLVNGEAPDFVIEEDIRLWGRTAYEHVANIVGSGFIE